MGLMDVLPWLISGGFAIMAATLWKQLGHVGEKLYEAEASLGETRGKLAEAIAKLDVTVREAQSLEAFVQTAMPIVKSLDTVSQSGEWKFHQAFAKLAPLMPKEKWRVGWAIHEALARLRTDKL